MNVIRFTPPAARREPAFSAADLPPSDRGARWVVSRKKQILRALNEGFITLADVCRRYNLTGEEIEEWRRHFRQHGAAGLRVTKLQAYRRAERENSRLEALPDPAPEAAILRRD